MKETEEVKERGLNPGVPRAEVKYCTVSFWVGGNRGLFYP